MANHSRSALLGLIETLYAAPGSEGGWMTFLRSLSNQLQGTGAHFISADKGHHPQIALTMMSPEAIASYHTGWGDEDPWRRRLELTPPGDRSVILGEELVPLAAMKRTAYYAGFARHHDLVHTAIGLLEYGPRRVSVVTVSRSEQQRTFDGEDASLLQALMPHLRRGLQLHTRLCSSDTAVANLSAVVEAMRNALILVDAFGRVTFTNGAAKRLFASGDGLTLDGDELRAWAREANDSLRRAIADAARTSAGDGVGAGGTVLVQRPSGRRPLVAVVSPVFRNHLRTELFAPEGAAAMVVISDPDAIAAAREDVLRVVFSLTAAEVRLARLLVGGATLAGAAVHLGISIETVRKRLKSMFEKTGTSRQPELMALLITTGRLSG